MTAIYLVLDMENDLVHEDGPNGTGGFGPIVRERDIVNKTASAITKARAAGLPIGFVRLGFSADYREVPPHSVIFGAVKANGLFKLGEWGSEIHPALGKAEGDFDIVKHRVSPFYGTSLEPILRANGIHTIYLSGISTNAVVQGAVRDGHDRDYRCVIVEDCCAAITNEEHQAAISGLTRFARITTSDVVDFAQA